MKLVSSVHIGVSKAPSKLRLDYNTLQMGKLQFHAKYQEALTSIK